MRHYAYFLALAALPACAQRATPQPPTAAAKQPTFTKPRTVSTIPINTAPTDTALVFQRTPCYGACPSYTATIFRNGTVHYHGERFVPVLGQRTLSVAPATVTAMLDEARRINFNSLEPNYRAQVSDMPATIITTYLPGQKRYQVFAEQGAAPKQLQAYIAYLQAKLDPLVNLTPDR